MKFSINVINRAALAVVLGILNIGIANADSSCEGFTKEYRDQLHSLDDKSEYVKVTRSFAEKGCAHAEKGMYGIYLTGEYGVEKDKVEARKWLVLAVEHGDEDAKFYLKVDDTIEASRAARAKIQASRSQYGWSLGMTKEEALRTRSGEPQTKNRTITATGAREIWTYANGTVYLYFNENGVLERISENN